MSVGTTDDLDKYVTPYAFVSPYPAEKIVGMAISNNDDQVYTWYYGGAIGRKVTVGQSDDLSSITGPYDYTKSFWAGAPLGIGISSEDKVYTWYNLLQMTRGISNDLDFYDANPIPFMGRGILPVKNSSLSSGDIAGIEAMY